ncbi:MAG: hypothetical protein QM784_38145 [Polyangiaceae bacterium]
MTHSKLTMIGSVAAGTIAAIVTVSVFEHLRREPQLQSRATPAVDHQPQNTVIRETAFERASTDSAQWQSLQAEVARLKSALEKQNPAQPQPSDPEEETKRVDAFFVGLDRRHREDPVDRSWAPSASAALESGLLSLAERHGFLLRSTECKTVYCRASIEWKDYDSAKAAGAVLVETIFPGLPCVQSAQLKPPVDPRAVYPTNLYLDCTSLREGLVEVASAPEESRGRIR